MKFLSEYFNDTISELCFSKLTITFPIFISIQNITPLDSPIYNFL